MAAISVVLGVFCLLRLPLAARFGMGWFTWWNIGLPAIGLVMGAMEVIEVGAEGTEGMRLRVGRVRRKGSRSYGT